MSTSPSPAGALGELAATASGATEQLVIHRFSVEQYYRMAELGILSPEDRVELLDGVIVDMNPIYGPRAFTVEEARDRLAALAPPGWTVRAQNPVSLGTSEPQPDVAVVRGRRRDFAQRHPVASEIGLLVEVADTTLVRDRGKAAIYAAAGVPEYWIVNLMDRQIEVYTDPRPADAGQAARYANCRVYGAKERFDFRLEAKSLGEIAVADLLP